MRVGIDVRQVYSNRRGFGRLHRFIEALIREGSEHEWILFGEGERLQGVSREDPQVQVEHPQRRLRMMRRPILGSLLALRFRDLSCFHFPTADIWYARCAPTVVTLHDLAGLRFPERFFEKESDLHRYRTHLDAVVRNADRVVTVSRFSRDEITTFFEIPTSRISVIRQGFESFHRDSARSEDEKEKLFLYCGGLDFRKNVDGLIRAFSVYRHRLGGDWRLVVTGERSPGRERFYPDLEKVAEQEKVRPWIDFVGWVDDSELKRLYQTAGGFVFPSLYEGFGYTPLEAMSAGVPVLCSGAAALPETVGQAALSADAEDPESFAQAMIRLSRDESLRRRLLEEADRQIKKFSWATMAQEHLDLYRETAREAGRR